MYPFALDDPIFTIKEGVEKSLDLKSGTCFLTDE